MAKQREAYRGFLRKFLPVFLRRLGVDIVVNSDARYRREADFVRVASELGVPHICYYREALYMQPAQFKHAVDRHRLLGPFYSRFIAVQNAVARQTFVEANICPHLKILLFGGVLEWMTLSKRMNNQESCQPASKGQTGSVFFLPKGGTTQRPELLLVS